MRKAARLRLVSFLEFNDHFETQSVDLHNLSSVLFTAAEVKQQVLYSNSGKGNFISVPPPAGKTS